MIVCQNSLKSSLYTQLRFTDFRFWQPFGAIFWDSVHCAFLQLCNAVMFPLCLKWMESLQASEDAPKCVGVWVAVWNGHLLGCWLQAQMWNFCFGIVLLVIFNYQHNSKANKRLITVYMIDHVNWSCQFIILLLLQLFMLYVATVNFWFSCCCSSLSCFLLSRTCDPLCIGSHALCSLYWMLHWIFMPSASYVFASKRYTRSISCTRWTQRFKPRI